jgi:hypothetical protein
LDVKPEEVRANELGANSATDTNGD